MPQLFGPAMHAVGAQTPQLRLLADLPPENTTRWVPARKAAVIAAVEAGLLTPEDANRRYNLTVEEYTAWKLALLEFGPAGLMITKQQKKRSGQSAAVTMRCPSTLEAKHSDAVPCAGNP